MDSAGEAAAGLARRSVSSIAGSRREVYAGGAVDAVDAVEVARRMGVLVVLGLAGGDGMGCVVR